MGIGNVLSPESLDLASLMRAAGTTITARGRDYYYQRRARVESVDSTGAVVFVRGSRPAPYVVNVTLDRDGRRIVCNCPYAEGISGVVCKHQIAAVLALEDNLRWNPIVTWRNALSGAVKQASRKSPPAPGMLILFSLNKPYGTHWRLSPHILAIKHVPEQARGDIGAMYDAIARLKLGENARPVRSRTDFSTVANRSPEIVAAVSLMADSFSYYCTDGIHEALLPYLSDLPIFLSKGQNPLGRRLTVSPEKAQLAVELARNGEGIRLIPWLELNGDTVRFDSDKLEVVSKKPLWLLSESTLVAVEAPHEVVGLFERNPVLDIPSEDLDEFLEGYLPSLAEIVPLRGDLVKWEEMGAESDPVRRIYLCEEEGELFVRLRFGYGEWESGYRPGAPAETIARRPGTFTLVRIHRHPELEAAAAAFLTSHGLKRGDNPGEFALRKTTSPVSFLLHQLPRFHEAGFVVHGEKELTLGRVNRAKPTLALTVSSGIDWFDIDAIVNFGESVASLKDIRRALRKHEQYVQLSDGSVGHLPDEWISRYRFLFGMGEETDAGLRLPKTQVTLLDALLTDVDQATVDEEFARRRDQLRDFSHIASHPIPAGFVGELRQYQHAGYDWLHFLHEYGFGGCLADDMGTGKTIQALALLLSLRESGHAKTADLLVLPRSLLYNWEREAARFAPSLRVHIHADQDRHETPAEFDKYDLILTTYGVMLRDLEMLRRYTFHYILLDESQVVKNPLSQTAKAARLLRGEHRLVLTGTPVENTSLDLWSQFAFLSPGLLGTLEFFREEFSGPIERKQDERAARLLRAMVYPFILRRTKAQVAPELPPRTERILFCDMEPAQRKLYNKTRDYYRALLLGLIEKEGMQSARMRVLEGLLRLRQISNHPYLVDKDFKGDSAKLEMLLDTLETLRSEGHKALVFSQFTSMLALVQKELIGRKIPYEYLDGHTKDRQERVDAFQEKADIPFFLISLRAGGVGLNLTAADYVIHIDPWWNPAVEQQASDRTHRIGQEKPVFIYKLIARESVEEKILQLQERKRALVSQLISTESSFVKNLTQEDVEVLFS